MNIKKIIALILIFINVGAFPVFAGSVSTYDILTKEKDPFVVRLSDGGLPNARINEFLTEFDSRISTLQVPEKREDMEKYFLSFLFHMLLEDEDFFDVCIVFDTVFQEEFSYILENDMALPGSFERFFMVSMDGLIKEDEEEETPEIEEGEEDIIFEEEEPEEEPEEEEPKEEPENKKIFSDLEGYTWAQEYIENLYHNGIMNGYEDKTFKPANNLTRAEGIKIICKSFLKSGYVVIKSDFSDIKKSDWFYTNVVNAEYYSIFYDIYEGVFNGNEKMTRQEFCTLAYRAYVARNGAMTVKNAGTDFFDNKNISSYAYKAVSTLQKAGVLNGDGNGNFNPKSPITRAEAAKVIYLILNYKPENQ